MDNLCQYSQPMEIPERCFTTLPVRRHIDFESSKIEDEILDAWETNIGTKMNKPYFGGRNTTVGRFDVLALPEAKPERLHLVIWLTEFFFLLDDHAELISREEAHEKLNLEVDAILAKEDMEQLELPPTTPMEKLLMPFMRKFLTMDYDRGVQVLRSWRHWLQNTDSKCANDFKSITDYANFRIVNIGILPYLATIPFLMELELSPEEIMLVTPIQHQACVTIGFVNDYWSWPKEKHFLTGREKRIMNAVAVLMRIEALEEKQAHEMVKALAIEYERKLDGMCSKILSSSPSETLRLYIHAHLWLVAGNSLWSVNCPRYHAWKEIWE